MIDTNYTNRKTHTVFSASRAALLVKLAIGCLILVLAIVLTVSTTQAKETSDGRLVMTNELPKAEHSDAKLTDQLTELGESDDELPVADRPGKLDGHNSTGDDVVVRNPR